MGEKKVVLTVTLDPLLCIFLPLNGMSHFIKYFAKRVLFHVIHWMNVFFLGSTQMNQPHTESVNCNHINIALFWASWRLRACFWWMGAAITRCFLFTIACKHFRGSLGDNFFSLSRSVCCRWLVSAEFNVLLLCECFGRLLVVHSSVGVGTNFSTFVHCGWFYFPT